MSNLILVKGNEVTRNTPPGHFNAIYIGDASKYIESRDAAQDKAAVMKAAARMPLFSGIIGDGNPV